MNKEREIRTMNMDFRRKPLCWREAGSWRRLMTVIAGAILILVNSWGVAALQQVASSASSNQPPDSDHLYRDFHRSAEARGVEVVAVVLRGIKDLLRSGRIKGQIPPLLDNDL